MPDFLAILVIAAQAFTAGWLNHTVHTLESPETPESQNISNLTEA